MNRFARAFFLAGSLAAVSLAQTKPATSATASEGSNATAYYNFSMGRVYALMAQSEGSQEHALKAVQFYKDALKADPKAGEIYEELTDLYLALSRPNDAMSLAQDILKSDPENVGAHRMLGRVYFSMISKGNNQVDERALRNALQEYQKVTEKDPKDAESWVTLGRLYAGTNDTNNAEKAYNAAMAADPDNEEALTGLAMLYGNMGDTAKAIEKLKAVTDRSPNERYLAILAQAYEDQKDFKNAADARRRILEMQPENDRMARALAEDLFFSDQYDEALKVFESLAAKSPKDPVLQLRMADIYRTKRDFVRAHAAIDAAKKIDPEGLEARQEEVRLFQAEGKLDAAIVALKSVLDDTARKIYSKEEQQQRAGWLEELGVLNRAAGHYPEAIEAFKQIAVVYKDAGPLVAVRIIETYRFAKDPASALREADAALKKYPDEYLIARAHAEVLSDAGKIDEAAKELRGLMGGPRDRETLVALTDVYQKAKRWEEAAKALDDAERISRSDDEKQDVFFMRGALMERQKKYQASEDAFRKVLELNPQHAGAMNYLGYMLADRNVRLEEAYKLIQNAVDLDPDNGAYLDSLGWVFYRQGKLPEAEKALSRAVLLTNQDPTVHEHLGDVYYQLGKTREAVTQWQASVNAFKAQPSSETDPEDVQKVNKKLDAARVKLAQEKQ